MPRIILIGTGPLARATANNLKARKDATVIGALSLPGDPEAAILVPILGTVKDLPRLLAHHHVDEVYLAGDVRTQYDAMQDAVRWCEETGTSFAAPVSPFRHQRSLKAEVGPEVEGFQHYQCTLAGPAAVRIKRFMDVAGAGLGLLVLAPLLLVLALLVRLDSRGPVLFRQVRVGRNGKLFAMLKFRSMRTDAEAQLQQLRTLQSANEQDGPVFKLAHDPRVTRMGRWMRRFSVDELPQLWNVVAGDMSLVGPRPPLPREVAQYAPWQRRRLSVRPGITCLWQVSGRNAIRFEQWMYLDLQYVDQWSLASDVRLLLRTIPTVLTGRNAS